MNGVQFLLKSQCSLLMSCQVPTKSGVSPLAVCSSLHEHEYGQKRGQECGNEGGLRADDVMCTLEWSVSPKPLGIFACYPVKWMLDAFSHKYQLSSSSEVNLQAHQPVQYAINQFICTQYPTWPGQYHIKGGSKKRGGTARDLQR